MMPKMFEEGTVSFPTLDFLHSSDETKYALIDKIAVIYKWVIFGVVCQLISIFGIGTNIINIICFVKQGFRDPVNVSFLGLAISDLGSLLTLIWSNVCMIPGFAASELPFDPMEIQYVISALPHTMFTCVAAWITAFITLERCLCITKPLKVNGVLTPQRVSVIVVCIFIVIASSGSPAYVVNKLGMKYFPDRNKTIIGIVNTANREYVESICYIINSFVLPFCAFVVITACTVTLVFQLNKKTQWRKKSTTIAQADNISVLNQKVARMVVTVSTIFIICFIPLCIIFCIMSFNSDLTIRGKYKEIVLMLGGIGLSMESTNSSVNIFVYYQMSSKYRHTFRQLFRRKKLVTCD